MHVIVKSGASLRALNTDHMVWLHELKQDTVFIAEKKRGNTYGRKKYLISLQL